MAKRADGTKMPIKEIALQENYPYAYVEKVFQSLRSAGIVISFQGNQGGYTLARPAKDINLKEIIEALEGHTFDIFCNCDHQAKEIICNHQTGCSLKSVWSKTKDMLDQFFASISLQMIADENINIDHLLSRKQQNLTNELTELNKIRENA
jgi:Rrf2 family protein